MCGRFTLTLDASGLQQAFPQFAPPQGPMPARYNIAPTQPIAAVANDTKNRVDFFVWGLIPSWAKDPKIGNQMINARAETLAEKPAFRSAYKRRRCLIFADGFYEWRKDGKVKVPTYVRVKESADAVPGPFAFAGLYEVWHSPHGDEIPSATIITTEANEFMSALHHRMPVILPRDCYDEWLDPAERPADKLQHLLAQWPSNLMVSHVVSTAVNNGRYDAPELILPVT
jgi:putative SOS response-associated peptidase YedK